MLKKTQLNRETVRKLLSAPAFATTLHAIVLNTLDPKWVYNYETDFLEIFAELQEHYSVTIHDTNKQRIQAILTAITTDSYFSEIEVFMAVSNTLLHGDPMFEDLDFDLLEVIWSLYEVGLNIENFDDIAMSHAIDKIAAKLMENEAEEDPDMGDPYYIKFLVAHQIKLFEELKLLYPSLELKDLIDVSVASKS